MIDDQGRRITTRVIEYSPQDPYHMRNCDSCQVIRVCAPHATGQWLCVRCGPPPRFASGGGLIGKAPAKVGKVIR